MPEKSGPKGRSGETPKADAEPERDDRSRRQLQQAQNMSYWARRMRKYAPPPDPADDENGD